MAGSVNKVILIGNLGADPEVRYTEGGQCVANVRIATNRAYNNREGNRVEETEWHRVVMWGKLGEIVEKWLKKGSTIYVEGRLRTRQWTDQNGMERYTTEVVAENMTMLGGRTDNAPMEQPAAAPQANPFAGQPSDHNPAPQQAAPTQPAAPSAPDPSDDLPF